MTFVDAHHHFWKIDLGIYNWISDDIAGIRRDYQPEHLAPYLNHLGIGRTVLVQAGESLLENDAMLAIAKRTDFVAGVVVWVDLASSDAAARLETLAAQDKVKSIRPVLQGIADSDWVLQPQVLENLRRLPDLNLCFDALVQPRHLPVLDRLTDMIPEMAVVIDHAAKPVIANGQAAGPDWETGMARLADKPQIYCKLSGMATEQGPGWQASTLQPVTDHLLSTFGPRRLMWGSDWPVLELVGSYTQWFEAAQQMLNGLSGDDRSWVMGKTASQFYSL